MRYYEEAENKYLLHWDKISQMFYSTWNVVLQKKQYQQALKMLLRSLELEPAKNHTTLRCRFGTAKIGDIPKLFRRISTGDRS